MWLMADIVISPVAFLTSTPWAPIVVGTAFVIMLEAVLLKFLKWGSLRRCIAIATVTNVVTTAIGLALAGTLLDSGPWLFPVSLALTIVIEASILFMVKARPSAKRVWMTSVLINFASYTTLFVVYSFLLF